MRKTVINSICIIFSLFILNKNLISQNFKNENKKSIGVSYSPNYCYRTLIISDDIATETLSVLNNDNPVYGYSIGLTFLNKFHYRWGYETGVFYSQVVGWERNIEFPKAKIEDTKFKLNAEVPLKINYLVYEVEKISAFASFGFIPNIQLATKYLENTYYAGSSISRDNQIILADKLSANIAVISGLGVNYSFSKNYFLRTEFTFRHSIFNDDKDRLTKSYKMYGYSLGASFGFYYLFK
ncbi:MAG: hypothetical protein OQJ96_05720 [Flavobacteriales bacterium]|nr:hypothetical protein [Flavobacteriales bacterium]MCW8914056.1 hypothetical protein [Flavobacteriales bacterium]MCW8938114.1 hypothetical protein [Flavobacteriales bacterium]MCW8968890.1 hypothetical protein [Flavobacteriales bacterium]MCW8991147.1 hypothetical protein [Flavobacteriales bacterium]